MATSVLSQASALNPGSDLWIVPDFANSQWTAKLDWYLNFQICRASRHQSSPIPDYLNYVLEETELKKPAIPVEDQAPLMIATQQLLPNKWVVLIPWNGNLGEWVQQAFKVWQNLQQPSIRLFLPPGQSSGSLQHAWQAYSNWQDLTVVLD